MEKEQTDFRKSIWDYLKPLPEVLIVIALLLMANRLGSRYLEIDSLRQFLNGWGLVAAPIFVLISAVMVLIPFPQMVAISVGSLVFGPVLGTLYSLLGFATGACGAFLAGRYCIGAYIVKLRTRRRNKRLETIETLLRREGLLAMISLRLVFSTSPIFNYIAGLSPVTLRNFYFGTCIGIIPRMFILSYMFWAIGEMTLSTQLFLHKDLLLFLILPLSRFGGVLMLKSFVTDDEKIRV